jgi:hypothetical protein
MRVLQTAMDARIELVRAPKQLEAPDERAVPSRLRGWVTWGLAIAGIAGVLFFCVWNEGAERRAIRDMPELQRRDLFARTLQNLKSICAPAESAMRDFCQEQARLAQLFPQCDHACQVLADQQLSRVQPPR